MDSKKKRFFTTLIATDWYKYYKMMISLNWLKISRIRVFGPPDFIFRRLTVLSAMFIEAAERKLRGG